jgi:hypothetical protein
MVSMKILVAGAIGVGILYYAVKCHNDAQEKKMGKHAKKTIKVLEPATRDRVRQHHAHMGKHHSHMGRRHAHMRRHHARMRDDYYSDDSYSDDRYDELSTRRYYDKPHWEDDEMEGEDEVEGVDPDSGYLDQFNKSNRVTPRKKPTRENFDGTVGVKDSDDKTDADSNSAEGSLKDADDGWDLFNPGQYLPKEKNSDWFEAVTVPETVKNQHLLMDQMGIGVSSIMGTNRNMSTDLRGDAPCPKFTVGPWNQSSINPTQFTKSLC